MNTEVNTRGRELEQIVREYGNIVVNYPPPRIGEGERELRQFQREIFATVFAPAVAGATSATIFGIGERVVGSLQQLSGVLSCAGAQCDVVRDVDTLRKFADFYADRHRVYAEILGEESAFPSYRDLICVYASATEFPVDWLNAGSIWNLGCLKTPLKVLSADSKKFVQASLRRGKLVTNIQLGHSGVSVVIYLPVELARDFCAKVFRLQPDSGEH